MLPPKQLMTEPPPPSAYVDQFMADLLLLPADSVAKLAEGIPEDEVILPLEKIRTHITANPTRIPQLFALVVREMPYYQVLRHFEWMERKDLFRKHGTKLIAALGPARACLGFMAICVLETGDKAPFTAIPRLPAEMKIEASQPPDMAKVAELDAELSKQLVPMDSLGKGDMAIALAAAEKRAVKAEKDLKDAQAGWLKREKRMAADAERAKKNAAEIAQGETGKVTGAAIESLKGDLRALQELCDKLKAELKVAEARLKEIEEQGGATPERVLEIRKEIQAEADQRIEDQLSIAVRPWMIRMIEMEKAHEYLKGAHVLSSAALSKAKQEAEAADFMVTWEKDRERGLKALEQEMMELDDLMIRIIKPSAELAKMHGDLLQAMLTCRKQLNPSKPHGEVAKALIAGLKKVKDEELGDAAYAVRQLAEKGVFLGLEAETLLKIVDGEKQARYDLTHFKKSVQGRMLQRLHAGQPVDILIDGYNYMFTAIQHFGDKLKLNKNAEGDAVFGEAGRAKLTSLLLPIVEKFPHLEVHVFYDGLVKENRRPYGRISLWEPTFQRSGKGQADAEITHVGLKRVRKGSMGVVVTNDKTVQRFADHFLSVRVFSDILATA